jgi:hypothetical protein
MDDVSDEHWGEFQGLFTVVVADVLVEIDLGVLPLAITALEAGPEDVAIVDANILGGVVERHGGVYGLKMERFPAGWGCLRRWRWMGNAKVNNVRGCGLYVRRRGRGFKLGRRAKHI